MMQRGLDLRARTETNVISSPSRKTNWLSLGDRDGRPTGGELP